MRPRGIVGQVRQALAESAEQLVAQRAALPVVGVTWREIAQCATLQECLPDGAVRLQRGVALPKAKQTVRDMVRAGELREVGRIKQGRHRLLLLAPSSWAGAATGADAGVRALDVAMRGWRAAM